MTGLEPRIRDDAEAAQAACSDTRDLRIIGAALYQLSYIAKKSQYTAATLQLGSVVTDVIEVPTLRLTRS